MKEKYRTGKRNKNAPSFKNGIFLQKLFWPSVRKNCPSDWEKCLKFEAEAWEFANILEITRTILFKQWKVSNNVVLQNGFFSLFMEVHQMQYIWTIRI